MDRVGDIPRLGFPLGYNLHFLVVFFIFGQRTAGEEDFGVEVFAKSVEGRCWFAVWSAWCRDEFEAEADDGGEGSGDVCLFVGEIMHLHIRRAGEIVP